MKKASLILSAVVAVTVMMLASFGSSSSIENADSFKEVTIGTQTWMAKNLNVDKFRNGDSIPEVNTANEWQKAANEGKPAWCYYHNDPKQGKRYGKYYNWYAVNDPRGLAPKGWHIPNIIEWEKLFNNLGGKDSAGKKMKSTSGWKYNGNGNNSSGFSGLPGGYRNDNGNLDVIGYSGDWWSSTYSGEDSLFALECGVNFREDNTGIGLNSKGSGLSVRCVRD